MIFAHASVGIIISWIIIYSQKNAKKKLSAFDQLLIWIAGAIGGIFPDFDLLYKIFIDPSVNHRTLISHSVIPYLLVTVGMLVIFKLTMAKTSEYLILAAFLLGILSHLLTDMLIGPVYFFNPLSTYAFSWDPIPLPEGASIIDYLISTYMMIEIAAILLSIILLIQSLSFRKKEFKLILFLLGTIQIGVWLALLILL